MTIKQQGGIFGRNPTFNDVEIEGTLTTSGGLNQSGDLTVDTDTLYVNSSSNEVCVGQLTAINAGKFNVKTDSAHNGISVTPYADNYYTYYGTNSAGSQTFYVRGDGISNFQGAMTVEGQINNTGNHVISSGNLVIGTSGQGIDFSATSGTGTSELLDDYEEGTWTPVFSDASSGGNTASGSAVGYYIKVGGLVYVTGQFENVNTTGMTGGNILYVQGIPYTPSSLPNDIFFMGSVKCDGVTNNGFLNVESADNFAWLRFSETNNTTAGFLTVGDFASGTADIYFSLCYRAI